MSRIICVSNHLCLELSVSRIICVSNYSITTCPRIIEMHAIPAECRRRLIATEMNAFASIRQQKSLTTFDRVGTLYLQTLSHSHTLDEQFTAKSTKAREWHTVYAATNWYFVRRIARQSQTSRRSYGFNRKSTCCHRLDLCKSAYLELLLKFLLLGHEMVASHPTS